jgi:hypothetical protein
VGEWWFEGREPATSSGEDQLRELLRRLALVAQIFESDELLLPATLTMSGWLTGDLDQDTLRRVEHDDVVLPVGRAAELADIAMAAVGGEAARSGVALYPMAVEVAGAGILLDAGGKRRRVPDVVWLWATTLAHHVVSVRVQSDAFLEWSVTGERQIAVWERNAPRLAAALSRAQEALGVEPSIEPTPHALVEGFRLRNHTDVDGGVIPTADA